MGKATVISSHEDSLLRAKLLNRLGIYKSTPVRVGRRNVVHTIRRPTTEHGRCRVLQEPLKGLSSEGKRRSIKFDDMVRVVCIPTRHEYSNRLKKFLWQDWEEIQENARRNRREFEAEGWDWHTVLEDDDMYVDATTGELIHPCWFEQEEEKQQEQLSSKEDEEMEEALEEALAAVREAGPQFLPLQRSSSFFGDLNELSE
eukprot:scaffold73_cov118-Cylindrotheca_fusiformis.AAC.11